jgi:hypothetical protein
MYCTLFHFLALLHWPEPPTLDWIAVMRVDILALFPILGSIPSFAIKCTKLVGCRVFVDVLYYDEEAPLHC